MSGHDEHGRVAALRDAQAKASELFDAVIREGLIAPGRGERAVSDQIRDLAHEMFGTRRFWHKRIVRAGENTLEPYRSNPPDRRIAGDDIVFMDFGPIFAEWEADFGRTYVLGDDPEKHRIAGELSRIWELGRGHFAGRPGITGAELFAYVRDVITEAGWGHPVPHAGHLIGEFPHEKVNGEERGSYITEGNDAQMRRPDARGEPCHWILEVHLTHPDRPFGAFFEQLLDI